MLTREECAECCKGPGKFEGEPIYAPHYWELTLDSGADEEEFDDANDRPVAVFKLTAEDHGLFPELEGGEILRIYEDEQGFVWSSVD
jgi:hypothetical protein